MLIPQENVKDLEEIPDNVKKLLTIIPVSHVDDVLKHALVEAPSPITDWVEVEDESVIASEKLDKDNPRPH